MGVLYSYVSVVLRWYSPLTPQQHGDEASSHAFLPTHKLKLRKLFNKFSKFAQNTKINAIFVHVKITY